MSHQKISVPLFALFLLVASILPGRAAGVEDCGRILRNRCEECHSKARICQALKRKNTNDWKRTVRAMLKKGARLSAEEQQQLPQCLGQKVPAVLAFCNDTIVK